MNPYQKVQRDPDGRAYFVILDPHGWVSKMPLPRGEEEDNERREADQ